MATVNLINVSKKLEQQVILDNIQLDIEKGEFVVVVGPSGSGKSTLLRLVAGLDAISSGSILINNECVNAIPAAKRNMAMVFQNYALYPHMTVYENMAYSLKLRGLKKVAIQKRVNEVASLLHINELLSRKPAMLSGGQRQRVAMGRAIVRSPAVFLFDEPLSNLDAKLRTEMRQEIKKLHQQLKTTSLYVTHDQTEAMTLADKVVVMNKGRIEQVGTPQQLYQYPASIFVGGFIGHYPMNFFAAELRGNKLVTKLGIELPLPNFFINPLTAANVTIGIRPEHLSLASKHSLANIYGSIEFIDDMGSDKLIQVAVNNCDTPILVRLFAERPIIKEEVEISLQLDKACIFCQKTGIRIGGWNEKEGKETEATN